MKLALVTTPASRRSGIGDYTRHLLPYLRRHADVRLFVADEYAGAHVDGEPAMGASALDPREHDQVLYQLGNEVDHAFMLPLLRRVGGTVALHDWVLFDMAIRAWPALARGGIKGHALALREGGVVQAHRYLQHWIEHRNAVRAEAGSAADDATLLDGWFAFEGNGRWASARARARVPAERVTRVRAHLHTIPGCRVSLRIGDAWARLRARGGEESLELEFAPTTRPIVHLETRLVRRTEEQRAHGDTRRLGTFVRGIEFECADGGGMLDLAAPQRAVTSAGDLSRGRFELALNRSVLSAAGAFVVHSEEVARRVRRVRGDLVPLGVVPHGAEKRFDDEDRRAARRRLMLPAGWIDARVCVSLGALQRHKRIERLLEGFARASARRPDLRLALVGAIVREDVDVEELVRRHSLEERVLLAGWRPEEQCIEFLRAADVCINLRGPSTGGTSGGIFQALSLGRAVIASDLAEQRELPDDCVIKVPHGANECDGIAEALAHVCDEESSRARMEAAARRFVETECHWSHVAKRYVESLRSFPAPRGSRRAGARIFRLGSRTRKSAA